MLAHKHLRPLALRLIEPISSANPCGDTNKNSSEIAAAKNEVAKGSNRDLQTLKSACEAVLYTQTKDISVFGFLMLALAPLEGVGAVCDCISALCILCVQYWDAIYPQRTQARLNAIRWLNEEKLLGTLLGISAIDSDNEAVRTALSSLEDLNSLLATHYPDNPPSLKGLQQILQKWSVPIISVQPLGPDLPSAAAAHNPVIATTPLIAAPPQNVALTSKADAQKYWQMLALYYLQQEPQSVVGYKLLRMLRWQGVIAKPKLENGCTLLAAPNRARVQYFAGLVDAMNWDELLAKSETAFTEVGLQFWFDLQYWVCLALHGKAGDYVLCAKVIEYEITQLLERVPDLAALMFKDNTPFANPETLAWISRLKSAINSTEKTSASETKTNNTSQLSADLQQAEKLVAAHKLDEAMALLESGLVGCPLREQWERKIAIARLCSLHKQALVAEHILADLCAASQAMPLEQWVPAFMVDLLELRVKNLNALNRSKEFSDKAETLLTLRNTYAWLAKLSPRIAANISLLP